jgi:hypothetical protein
MALTVDDLLARQEIADVLFRYSRGVDRYDLDLVRSCYHPDAYDDHGAFKGTLDEFIKVSPAFLKRWTVTQHFLGNMLIEVDGDVARAETYAIAFHRREDAEGSGKDDIMGIRYVDRFERRDDEWKIAYRATVAEWRRVEPFTGARGRNESGLWGQKDATDAIHWILGAQPDAV